MALRLHMSLEADDEPLFHKSFYVMPTLEDPRFVANEGVKILHKLLAAEVKNYFDNQHEQTQTITIPLKRKDFSVITS